MKRIWLSLLALTLIFTMVSSALAAPGDANDPVVSLSYLDETFKPALRTEYESMIANGLAAVQSASFKDAADSIATQRLSALKADSVAKSVQGTMLLKKGDVLTLSAGCKVTPKNGTIQTETAALVDVTSGTRVASAIALIPKTLYMMSDESGGRLVVNSTTCEIAVTGVCTLTPSDRVDYGSMANALNTMGLFSGTATGFALENGANRAQGVVMFLRILGLEDEAAAYKGTSPFTDVPKTHWAHNYVAYAYHNGLAAGTSATRFAPESAITCQHYATFLMRALNYKEGTDFTYQTAVRDMSALEIFTGSEMSSLSTGSFARYQMVYLSYYVLFAVDQSSGDLLMTRLVNDGTVKEQTIYDGICKVYGGRIV